MSRITGMFFVALGGLAALMALPMAVAGDAATELAEPVRLLAGDKPIDVEVGHAAPFLVDFDGDGTRDLLVGQFGGGKLRVFRNLGTNEDARYDQFEWFQAGDAEGKVPGG